MSSPVLLVCLHICWLLYIYMNYCYLKLFSFLMSCNQKPKQHTMEAPIWFNLLFHLFLWFQNLMVHEKLWPVYCTILSCSCVFLGPGPCLLFISDSLSPIDVSNLKIKGVLMIGVGEESIDYSDNVWNGHCCAPWSLKT